jgi:hypothetical protein
MSSTFASSCDIYELISCELVLFSRTLLNSSIETLFDNKYYKSLFYTFSSSSCCISSKEIFDSSYALSSAIVRETSVTFAFSDRPALSSLLLHFVGKTLSSSLIASPYDLITSQTALSVSFIMS